VAVRVFSSSSVTFDEGTLDNIPNGAWTFASIFKRSGSTTDGTQFLLSLNAGAGSSQRLSFSYSSASALQVTGNGVSRTFGASFTISNNTWYCFVVTKGSGTATPRANLYNYGSSTWVGWTTGSDTLDADSTTIVEAQAGNAPGVFPLNGKLACMGMWSSVLSDTNAETLETAAANWLTLSPTAMWRFNQDSTGTAITDDSGNGATQTAITGTSVDTGDDPPGFDFAVGGTTYVRPTVIVSTAAVVRASRW
jgi:hypothetical protein